MITIDKDPNSEPGPEVEVWSDGRRIAIAWADGRYVLAPGVTLAEVLKAAHRSGRTAGFIVGAEAMREAAVDLLRHRASVDESAPCRPSDTDALKLAAFAQRAAVNEITDLPLDEQQLASEASIYRPGLPEEPTT